VRPLWIAWILVRNAWRGVRASPVTSVVAVATIAVALVLVGAFALLVTNMQGLLERFGEELQVVAYLSPDLDDGAFRELATRVSTLEGVERVELVSREEALDRFRRSLGGELLEGLDRNPLPASLEISLRPGRRTPEGIASLVDAVAALPGVEDLAHGQDWVEGYARAVALVRSAALALGIVLAGAALLIVANTIRLAVYAREEELGILSLVGASRTFVRVPFLLEGSLQGALGGALAVALLYGAWLVLLPRVEYGLELFLGHQAPRFFTSGEMLALVGGGAGLGLLGSLAALAGWRA